MEYPLPDCEEILHDLFVAMFAVAGWRLETANTFVEKLSALLSSRFSDQRLDEDQIAKLLVQAGFNRGSKVLQIMSERVHSAMKFLTKENLALLKQASDENDDKSIRQMLSAVKGIGPKVLDNFLLLRTKSK